MGIWIAAAIATVLAPAILVWPLRRLSAPGDRRALLLGALLALPLQPLAFHAIRMPLHHALEAMFGPGAVLGTVSLFYAPLTEEPAKWLVLALPWVRRALRPDNAMAIALAVGLGFAIGEFWFIASMITNVPGVAEQPFWMFSGYLFERLQVAFLHGAFILWFARALAAGRSVWPGALLGMALHFAANLPIVLISLNPFGFGRAVWTQIVSFWIIALTITLLVALRRLARGDGVALFGTSSCPECGAQYPRPILLAINLGTTRIERCPHCRHWHRMPARAAAVAGRPPDRGP